MAEQAILCVDDEQLILMALKSELSEAFGSRFLYEVALNADEALSIIAELKSDGIELMMILSDWLMPGIKGDEFLGIVQERYPGIKAIMITGHANAATIQKALDDGRIVAVLNKPWDSKELIALILAWCFGNPEGSH